MKFVKNSGLKFSSAMNWLQPTKQTMRRIVQWKWNLAKIKKTLSTDLSKLFVSTQNHNLPREKKRWFVKFAFRSHTVWIKVHQNWIIFADQNLELIWDLFGEKKNETKTNIPFRTLEAIVGRRYNIKYTHTHTRNYNQHIKIHS